MRERLSDSQIEITLARYGLTVSPGLSASIRSYISILLRWNRKISLTTVVEPLEILKFHFGESFFASKFIENPACRLADVGSGAGFPGLALKIVLPNLQVSLIEQDTRKATFLNEVIRLLDLAGVRVHRSPYESLPPEFGNFDFIAARAVGNHKELLKWAAARFGPDGQIMLWLGADDAIRVSQLPGWQWHLPHALPNSRNRILLLGVAAK